MRKPRAPEDLTVEELRRLLVEKRRSMRQEHRERFRRTGRVVLLASDTPSIPFDPEHATTGGESTGISEAPAYHPSRRRRLADWLLLLVEVAAVAGLIWVVFSGFKIMQNLNAEFSQALTLPTLTPTPLIAAVVLPSGHTPPNSPGGAQPNEEEIPEHLRPLVQQLASIPIPTPGPQQAIRIQIPAIRIDAPVVQGDGWEQLKKGVAQAIGTANPGENGNIVLSAHNDIFGEYFRDLDKLKPGDQVLVYSNQRSFTYIITGSEIVEKDRVDVMAPTTQPVVTLISCYPYMVDNKRIVVRASLQSGTN
jgi:sortase A